MTEQMSLFRYWNIAPRVARLRLSGPAARIGEWLCRADRGLRSNRGRRLLLVLNALVAESMAGA
jgi:hypothetical protein